MKNTKELLRLLLEEPEEAPSTFEDNPMEFILRKYVSLDAILTELMTSSYREYIDGIYIMAPKPTTFKVVFKNEQHIFLTYMGPAYEASVSGKNYYLLNIGEKERCMLAISKILRGGSPIPNKGPEGAEQAADAANEGGDEGDLGDVGAPEEGGGSEETGGGEEALTEMMILEAILRNHNITEAKGVGSKGHSAEADLVALMKKHGLVDQNYNPKFSSDGGDIVFSKKKALRSI